MDNGWNSELAQNNIENLDKKIKCRFIMLLIGMNTLLNAIYV